MAEAISDTGPILHLQEIGWHAALGIFTHLIVPDLVAEELRVDLLDGDYEISQKMRGKRNMMRLGFWPILLCVALVGCIIPPSAYACSCEPPPSPAIALQRADVVFAGTVVGIEERLLERWGPMLVVTFTVGRLWKGIEEEEITVVTGRDEASCGYGFVLGEAYVVYGHRQHDITDEGGFLPMTGICDRTQPLRGAQEEVRELSRATAVGHSLWGRIKAWFSGRVRPPIRLGNGHLHLPVR